MIESQFWWATVYHEGEPQVVRVSFKDGEPRRIKRAGTEVDILAREFIALKVRLIERVLPAGRAAAAIERLDEIAGEKWPWRVVEEISAILQGEETES